MGLPVTIINNNYNTEPYCIYPYCSPQALGNLGTEVFWQKPGRYICGVQVVHAIYNITNLRILWEIASDGDQFNNYLASSQASSDKGITNVKSDIIEQYWQSTAAVGEYIQFDAGSGKTISLDTFALIAHNLTSSAIVNIYGQGSGASPVPASWIGVPLYATMTMPSDPDENNLIWIAPTLPKVTYRHWRVTIQDPSNPLGALRIGRVVGGSSLIFTGENCLDSMGFHKENYKDEFKLNGFSNIANNRALKKTLNLEFRNLDRIAELNYRRINRYVNYCRDTLKALVIPDPQVPYQFSVYSKLSKMPQESHRFISQENSYASFSFEYDEGR